MKSFAMILGLLYWSLFTFRILEGEARELPRIHEAAEVPSQSDAGPSSLPGGKWVGSSSTPLKPIGELAPSGGTAAPDGTSPIEGFANEQEIDRAIDLIKEAEALGIHEWERRASLLERGGGTLLVAAPQVPKYQEFGADAMAAAGDLYMGNGRDEDACRCLRTAIDAWRLLQRTVSETGQLGGRLSRKVRDYSRDRDRMCGIESLTPTEAAEKGQQ